ncbi:MAG: hypothetical protein LBR91_01775 [Puniceicoccales bacterium]|jgi:hypothetical protein|nr:hypothetical protein [Puniceicoccales bacterium]
MSTKKIVGPDHTSGENITKIVESDNAANNKSIFVDKKNGINVQGSLTNSDELDSRTPAGSRKIEGVLFSGKVTVSLRWGAFFGQNGCQTYDFPRFGCNNVLCTLTCSK